MRHISPSGHNLPSLVEELTDMIPGPTSLVVSDAAVHHGCCGVETAAGLARAVADNAAVPLILSVPDNNSFLKQSTAIRTMGNQPAEI